MPALPTWPWLLFGVVEPFLLYVSSSCQTTWKPRRTNKANSVWGTVVIFQDPRDFINKSAPSIVPLPLLSGGTVVIISQLANIYLLLAAVQALCCWSRHLEIARTYIGIVAVADLGHIYATYLGMGEKMFWDWQNWNDVAWGNIGFSAFLCLNRVATILGLFGRVGASTKAKRS